MMDFDPDQPPAAFGFWAFLVLTLSPLTLGLLVLGGWSLWQDLRQPLWGPDELAPLAFVMPFYLGVLATASSGIAAALTLGRGPNGAIMWTGRFSFGASIAFIAAVVLAPAYVFATN
jgi:hypothetical protein